MNHKQNTNNNSFIKKIFSFFNSNSSFSNRAPVVVRIAPSPTGNLHIGTARTALFNYIFAKQNKGKFILRIEDTDKERSKPEYELNIEEGLKWLGLDFDEKFKQSERTQIYKNYIEKLLSEKKAYISKEEAKEGQRSEVIRFKNPNKKILFTDVIRGEIEFDTTELGDFVIAKSIDEPLYHLAVVIDDHDLGITHVIRGEDHISNTPRQILIQEAIGATMPIYAHLALILNTDRSKLSKRSGATSVIDYKESGYLPEAFVNFIAMMGWAPKDEKEIFSMEELISVFKIEDLQKGGAIFNLDKLKWFNKEWIKNLSDEELLPLIKYTDRNVAKRALHEIRERVETLNDFKTAFEDEFRYLTQTPNLEIEKINWKDNSKEVTIKHLSNVCKMISDLDFSKIKTEQIKTIVFEYANQEGRGDVLSPLRYSLSGKDKSIDPFSLIYILGKDESLTRIKNAIEKLK